jgi:hypothetical protein
VKKFVLAAAMGLAGCFCDGCIAVGSAVLTPQGRRRIETLKPGDEVICVDPATGARVTSAIAATRTVKRETFLLQGEGWSLRCSSDHPLYDPSTHEWAPAGDWMLAKRSALLLVADEPVVPRQVLVTGRSLDGLVTELIDLSVAHELHNFVAEGILVHNKPPIRSSCSTPGSGFAQQPEGNACACGNGSTGELSCPDGITKCVYPNSSVDCAAADGGP